MTFYGLMFVLLVAIGPLVCEAQYHAGMASLVIHPTRERNWRGAKTHALVTIVWYPVSVDAVEKPIEIGAPGKPLFHAGSAVEGATPIADPAKLPLIVMSHGFGGSAMQLAWLGTVLARHGYVVAAVNHPGNNALEPYTGEGSALWWERGMDLSDVVEGLLKDPTYGVHIDAKRIAAAGFSMGGYTMMELAGARVDFEGYVKKCRSEMENLCRPPEMKGMPSTAEMIKGVRASSAESIARSGASYRDARIKAVFAIAPGMGPAFHANSFRDVTIPITIVAGSSDNIAPIDSNAEQYERWLPQTKLAILEGVGHYTFLDTCSAEGARMMPPICKDEAGIDRDAVHAKVAGMAVSFFDKTLAFGR